MESTTATRPAAATPAAPIILVTTAHPSLHQHPGPDGEAVHPRLGRLLQPRHLSSVELTAEAGIPWAADNDCFQGLDERAYRRMLDRLEGLPGCLFVTVPDTVGDAEATLASYDEWAPELLRRGFPLALVAQDGMTVADLQERAGDLAALFIGGSTEWKEGPEAAELAVAAKAAGLWVHWGRVNTKRRFDLIVATGAADSFDGSKWARFRKTYLPGGLEWLDAAAANRRAALALPVVDLDVADESDDPSPTAWPAIDTTTTNAKDPAMPLLPMTDARKAAAELAILHAYDLARSVAGHDYGGGQRANELRRRERELKARERNGDALVTLAYAVTLGNLPESMVARAEAEAGGALTPEELGAAWASIYRTRVGRIERRETYRLGTPATRRTLGAWRDVRKRLEARVAVMDGTPDNVAARFVAVAGDPPASAVLRFRHAIEQAGG